MHHVHVHFQEGRNPKRTHNEGALEDIERIRRDHESDGTAQHFREEDRRRGRRIEQTPRSSRASAVQRGSCGRPRSGIGRHVLHQTGRVERRRQR